MAKRAVSILGVIAVGVAAYAVYLWLLLAVLLGFDAAIAIPFEMLGGS